MAIELGGNRSAVQRANKPHRLAQPCRVCHLRQPVPLGAISDDCTRWRKIALLQNPSLYRSRIVWTEERSGVSYVRLDWVGVGPRRTLERMRTRLRGYWTTTLGPGRAYWTRWTVGSGAAAIYRGTY